MTVVVAAGTMLTWGSAVAADNAPSGKAMSENVMSNNDMTHDDMTYNATPESSDSPITGAIKVAGQRLKKNTVTVDTVKMPTDGWLVIHDSDAKGRMIAAKSIGDIVVSQGTHHNVSLTLTKRVRRGDTLYAELYDDTGVKGKFELASSGNKADRPVMAKGRPVVQRFKVE